MTFKDSAIAEHDVLAAWFERPRVARVIMDDAGRVLRANAAAHKIFRECLGLVVREGVLGFSQNEAQRALRNIIRKRKRGYLALRTKQSRYPTMVMIDPLPGDLVAVRLWRARRPPLAMLAPLASFCGLSQQQARVAAELISGRSVEGIARKLGVTVDTVRSHLKAVYEKTGARSQAEVVALVARCMAA